MNKQISNIIREIDCVKSDPENSKVMLSSIKSQLEDVLSEEEDSYDNIPENLQGSFRAEMSQEAIDYMEEAVDALGQAINSETIDKLVEELDRATDELDSI